MPFVYARIVAVVALAGGAAWAGTARQKLAKDALDKPVPSKVASEKLKGVRDKVAEMADSGRSPVVIFDIDKTLVTAPRGGGTHNGAPSLNVRARPGAIDYVKSLQRAGGKIVYLTGRRTDQRDITVELFHKIGMPLGRNTHLLLNPATTYDKKQILEWKQSAKPLIEQLGKPVAIFDDNKTEVRMFAKDYPKSAEVFRLKASSHERDPGGTRPVTVIRDF